MHYSVLSHLNRHCYLWHDGIQTKEPDGYRHWQ